MHSLRQHCAVLAALLSTSLWAAPPASIPVATSSLIADAPISATRKVPANLLLALSVEWPTGVVAAYNDNASITPGYECPGRVTDAGVNDVGVCFFASRTYLGYFDPDKCYAYDAGGYFKPNDTGRRCRRSWSGNFLNWATMQAIDTFRHALTGGDRVVDSATQTVIEKARHTGIGGHSQFPIKRVQTSDAVVGGTTIAGVDPRDVSPYSDAQLFVRVTADGSELRNTFGSYDGPRIEASSSPHFPAGSTQSFLARVEVCNGAAPGGLESNCERYGSAAKPIGLIQRYADRLNVGVFGYLLDSSSARGGGVLRARMKAVGPNLITPFGLGAANPAAEWDATTGSFYANPDSADATASGVGASGVINYLNRFGKSSGYKSYDPIGELYYEGLRYFKNLGPTPEYSSGATAAMGDGFPVITHWNDPVQYACQKNTIAMVADVNAWCDTRLPGTRIGDTGTCGGGAASAPSNADPAIDVGRFVDRVAALEGAAGLGGASTLADIYAPAATGRRNSWYIAGLAHYANTTDLRPDRTSGTSFRSTVRTFMIDVAETGSWSVSGKNQMWLAAKYGGFDDVNRDGVPATTSAWDANGDGVPDSYFLASRPDKMIAALANIFENAIPKTESAVGATVASPRILSGEALYQVQYDSTHWTGELIGNTASFDANGEPTLTRQWSARTLLDAQVAAAAGTGWDTHRIIATWDGSTGVAFRRSRLSATQKAALGATGTEQQDVLEYLRGSRAKEGSPLRVRSGILGDIVNSEAVVVGTPSMSLRDSDNPGYEAFKASHAARPRRIYIGANDGMLHAFDGSVTSASGGTEKWAYVPGVLFNGPSSPATPRVDGLAALAQTTYRTNHRAFVDATPVVADVDFARAGVPPVAATSDWRTILVGGLGKGGRGFYAIDITDPSAITSEADLAAKVLWEFTDPDLGLSFGEPAIIKTRKYGWVVVVSSGYDNTRGMAANQGKGFLYVLDPRSGAILQKIATGVGSATLPSGLTHLTGYTISYADFTTEQIYGGDLYGNLWRFDLSQAADATPFPAPMNIATLTDALGASQPITTAPRIEASLNGAERWVFVGSGYLMDHGDLTNTQAQTMYAFRDGTRDQPFNAASLPGGVSFPLARTNLVAVSDLSTGVPRPTGTQMGWFVDLEAGERVITQPIANEGVFAWVGALPTTDPCAPGLNSRTYAVRYDTGQSVLTSSGPAMAPPSSTAVASPGIVKLQFMRVNGRIRLIGSDSATQVANLPGRFSGSGLPAARVNWREILE